jgi:hypothetical protein
LVARKRRGGVAPARVEPRVFLDIPYKKSFRRYEDVIRAALIARGLVAVVARDTAKSVLILGDVRKLIDSCQYAIVDISGWNFNVALESGYILARGLPFILLKNKRTRPPADLQGVKYLEYSGVDDMRNSLVEWVEQTIPEAQVRPEAIEAKELVERIMKEANLSQRQAEEVLLSMLQSHARS